MKVLPSILQAGSRTSGLSNSFLRKTSVPSIAVVREFSGLGNAKADLKRVSVWIQ